jgi:uncharacterized oligopeptide transporter (OPT) family protein
VQETAERRGLLFASGLITGEALAGILLAIPFMYYVLFVYYGSATV